MKTLTVERARELLDYDPETGIITNRVPRNPRAPAGVEAGSLSSSDGYRYIKIDKRSYPSHRVAWFLMLGRWPTDQVDHINGNRTDNRWINLRNATPRVNHENRRPQSNNTSGLLGVSWITGRRKYAAQIKTHGKVIFLGLFSDPEEAHAVYVAKKREIHAGCTI